jgi:hypothetical protein
MMSPWSFYGVLNMVHANDLGCQFLDRSCRRVEYWQIVAAEETLGLPHFQLAVRQ